MDTYNAEAIKYWDSLLIEAKAKEAYYKGQKVIRDSADGNFYRKEKFEPSLDTICTENVIDDSKKEFAKYANAEDYIKARDNTPDTYAYIFKNTLVSTTHYWNLITMTGRQNEAYQKGMSDARKEIKNK